MLDALGGPDSDDITMALTGGTLLALKVVKIRTSHLQCATFVAIRGSMNLKAAQTPTTIASRRKAESHASRSTPQRDRMNRKQQRLPKFPEQ